MTTITAKNWLKKVVALQKKRNDKIFSDGIPDYDILREQAWKLMKECPTGSIQELIHAE